MNVEARDLKINNVLKKGVFTIPDYQREYDWGNDEVTEFLDDINETNEDESYFIGHIVLEGSFGNNSFKVIDGQQRITTITILLCVIRDLFYVNENNDLAEGINNNYIFGKDIDNQSYTVLVNKMSYPLLRRYVQSIPENKNHSLTPNGTGEKQIKKIYDMLKDKFAKKSIDELKSLRDKILNVEIIFVAVENEVNAFTIFETLNATGKNLSPVDLMKNKIFHLYDMQPDIDEPKDTWQEILQNADGKMVKFLNNFWSSRYKKVANIKIYKEFIKKTNLHDFNVNSFLENLKIASSIFKKINTPQRIDWQDQNEIYIYYSLNAIVKIFNIDVANSFLMTLLSEYQLQTITLKYLIKIFNMIEKYHFINNAINSNRSSGLDIMYGRFSREIRNCTTRHDKHTKIDDIIQILNEKMPSFDNFRSKFDEKVYYNSNDRKQKKIVQYILRKIERKCQNDNIEIQNISLEHIYPENPNEQWEDLKDPTLCKNIGNIILLDTKLNSQIGNRPFNRKKTIILEQSTVISTKNVLNEANKWGDLEIGDRRDNLIEYMYNDIWNG